MSRFHLCTDAVADVNEQGMHWLASAHNKIITASTMSAQIIQVTNLNKAVGDYKLAVEATCS